MTTPASMSMTTPATTQSWEIPPSTAAPVPTSEPAPRRPRTQQPLRPAPVGSQQSTSGQASTGPAYHDISTGSYPGMPPTGPPWIPAGGGFPGGVTGPVGPQYPGPQLPAVPTFPWSTSVGRSLDGQTHMAPQAPAPSVTPPASPPPAPQGSALPGTQDALMALQLQQQQQFQWMQTMFGQFQAQIVTLQQAQTGSDKQKPS